MFRSFQKVVPVGIPIIRGKPLYRNIGSDIEIVDSDGGAPVATLKNSSTRKGKTISCNLEQGLLNRVIAARNFTIDDEFDMHGNLRRAEAKRKDKKAVGTAKATITRQCDNLDGVIAAFLIKGARPNTELMAWCKKHGVISPSDPWTFSIYASAFRARLALMDNDAAEKIVHSLKKLDAALEYASAILNARFPESN